MISIIVPVYKVEPYLRQCVESILAQTYRDIEVLLIDDGSPDRCGEICDEYGRQDARVRVFHTENRGLSTARNLGLREAKGEYIGFVDSDDWIEPDMYEVLLRRMQETGADISVCGWFSEFENTSIESHLSDELFDNQLGLLKLIKGKFRQAFWNKLFKSATLVGVRFPEGHVFEDAATIYKPFLASPIVASTHKALYHYRLRNGSICFTHTADNLIDYWNAYQDRYEVLAGKTIFKNSQQAMNQLLEMTVKSVAVVWRWIYELPREERKEHMRQWKAMSLFVRQNWTKNGFKTYGAYSGAMLNLSMHPCEISFFMAYYMNQIYRRLRKAQTGL